MLSVNGACVYFCWVESRCHDDSSSAFGKPLRALSKVEAFACRLAVQMFAEN